MIADGGVKDRLGLSDWAKWSDASVSKPRRAIVHVVGTSAKKAKVDPSQRLKYDVVTPADTPRDYAPEGDPPQSIVSYIYPLLFLNG